MKSPLIFLFLLFVSSQGLFAQLTEGIYVNHVSRELFIVKENAVEFVDAKYAYPLVSKEGNLWLKNGVEVKLETVGNLVRDNYLALKMNGKNYLFFQKETEKFAKYSDFLKKITPGKYVSMKTGSLLILEIQGNSGTARWKQSIDVKKEKNWRIKEIDWNKGIINILNDKKQKETITISVDFMNSNVTFRGIQYTYSE